MSDENGTGPGPVTDRLDAAVRPADLTLAEKAGLTSGADAWRTKAVDRVGVPAIMVTDGPHGLRKEAGTGPGLGPSVPATCFPPAVALGASFDPVLAERVGEAIGTEAAIEDVAVVLGPGINIKRSPLCGRNFEYFSEDPLLSGLMGAGLVRGIQSRGVGACVKHFAANNQETDRMRVSVDVDARTLREIYLRGFEIAVREGRPWTLMCSYNRIEGVYSAQNRWLLTEVLREEWGFDGLVVSDWGAVADRVASIAAGLDLEMPATGGYTDGQVVRAVAAGDLAEADLDTAAGRVLELVRRAGQRPPAPAQLNVDAHHDLAREVAGRCVVLLQNTDELLPLATDARLAVIGAFAQQPRYQGAGSSRIDPTRLEDALTEIRALGTGEVTYAPGFTLDGAGDVTALRAEAVRVAAGAEVAVLFLGLPPEAESEGFDREHLDLPAEQVALLAEVLAATENVVLVLSHGGVVHVPQAEQVPAIVDASLLGQAGGGATADVLFGRVNPSARLSETVPLRLADTPAFGNFPGENGQVRYGEGQLVGYRWYDARTMPVAFPFGHGLSYTTFSYGQASVVTADDGGWQVRVPVTNTGGRLGREVVQVYVSLPGSAVSRPPRELKGFASVEIPPGQTAEVEVAVPRSALAVWDVRTGSWWVEGGQYLVQVGASSRDLRTSATVELPGDGLQAPLTRESSLAEVLADRHAAPLVAQAVQQLADQVPAAAGLLQDEEMMTLMSSFPVGRLPGYGGLPITEQLVDDLLSAANAARGTPEVG
ncbi:glycoside hydrolase family 3 C-terminal domain-containing protein [Ruania albidiflava]|uniref:glycoside hydrolase family 3 C-terminal domain-containing protein n=1 Tax=Ruania albidiflava TaxID=366586 RepID=UPI0023F185F3|nr:glycoside hydrolase family 3 C-terminal domain-containing protein [Ruania albidiflava]